MSAVALSAAAHQAEVLRLLNRLEPLVAVEATEGDLVILSEDAGHGAAGLEVRHLRREKVSWRQAAVSCGS